MSVSFQDIIRDRNLIKDRTVENFEILNDMLSFDGLLLNDIKDQNLELCLTAISQNKKAITCVNPDILEKYPELKAYNFLYRLENSIQVIKELVEPIPGVCDAKELNSNLESTPSVFIKACAVKSAPGIADANSNLESTGQALINSRFESTPSALNSKYMMVIINQFNRNINYIINMPYVESSKIHDFVIYALETDFKCVKHLGNYYHCNKVNKKILSIIDKKFEKFRYLTNNFPNYYDIAMKYIEKDKYNLDYVTDKNDEFRLAVLQKFPETIGQLTYFINTNFGNNSEFFLSLIKKDGLNLRLINYDNQKKYPEICIEAVKQNALALQYAIFKTPEICLIAAKQNKEAIKYIRFRDFIKNRDFLLDIVKADGTAIQYFNYLNTDLYDDTYIYLEAIKQNPKAIRYIPENIFKKNEELCKVAISDKGCYIKYIKNPSYELCKNALENGASVKDIDPDIISKYSDLVETAVKSDWKNIEFVKQTYELCSFVIQHLKSSSSSGTEGAKGALLPGDKVSKNPKDSGEQALINFIFYLKPYEIGFDKYYEIVQSTLQTNPFSPFRFSDLYKIAAYKMYNPLPEFVGKIEDFEDPMILGPIEKNSLYAFYSLEQVPKVPPSELSYNPGSWTCKFYVAGSFETIRDFIKQGFKGSSHTHVFVPLLNKVVSFKELIWFST